MQEESHQQGDMECRKSEGGIDKFLVGGFVTENDQFNREWVTTNLSSGGMHSISRRRAGNNLHSYICSWRAAFFTTKNFPSWARQCIFWRLLGKQRLKVYRNKVIKLPFVKTVVRMDIFLRRLLEPVLFKSIRYMIMMYSPYCLKLLAS